MRSGDLLAYLSLNCLFNGVVSCSWWYFVQIQFVSQKFNSLGTDRRTDGRTDRRTDTPSYRDARTHPKRSSRRRRGKQMKRKIKQMILYQQCKKGQWYRRLKRDSWKIVKKPETIAFTIEFSKNFPTTKTMPRVAIEPLFRFLPKCSVKVFNVEHCIFKTTVSTTH